jgi:hypothetical protein
MGDPVGNALALGGLFIIAMLALQALGVLVLGVSLIAIARRLIRRLVRGRRPPNSDQS